MDIGAFMSALIQIKNLYVEFATDEGTIPALKGVSFDIPKGRTLGLVGESGSGKSVSAMTILQLIPTPPGRITNGEIIYNGKNILAFSERQMRNLRGNRISMIFQEPMTSLNPVFTVGEQISETLRLHQNMNKSEAKQRAIELLHQVGITQPSQRVKSYPHEMSGGQRQRVMIAMAISCQPELLIADEPTTALDVTIQKQILDLLAELQQKTKMSILFITHDLSVIADIADEVDVMYQGEIVERGFVKDIFTSPQHPYTKGLLTCRPSLKKNPNRLPMVSDFMTKDGKEINFDIEKTKIVKEIRPISSRNPVILEVKDLKKSFPLKKNIFGKTLSWIHAVDGVNFKVRKGRTLGLVGESGCGKTTIGRTILRLIEASDGNIIYKGQDITFLKGKELRKLRRKIQIIFQDPYASLNPRMTIGKAIKEPMEIHHIGADKKEREDLAGELMEKVGLERYMLKRYPHEFSGGQRQRICIARALAVKPEFIVCDESVSALDVSVQAQILNLLLDLQDEFDLAYIFISHDLAVVRFIADEIAVINQGQMVEIANAIEIYQNPKESYTKSLINAIPKGIPKGAAR